MTTEDPDKSRIKVTADPDSTWGAAPEAKAEWVKKFGKKAEKAAEEKEKA